MVMQHTLKELARYSRAQYSRAQQYTVPSSGGGGGPARTALSTRHGHCKTVCADISLQFQYRERQISLRVCVAHTEYLFRMATGL